MESIQSGAHRAVPKNRPGGRIPDGLHRHLPEAQIRIPPGHHRSTPMRRSFRTHELHPARTQGFTLGWYALPRWGRNYMSRWVRDYMSRWGRDYMSRWVRDYMSRMHGPVGAFFAPTGRRIPAKGETLDRATPWEPCQTHPRVLKERRISRIGGSVTDRPLCGVPSERMNCISPAPRVAPRAGMHCPVGAGIACLVGA